MFSKVAVAVAASPTLEALLAEAQRLQHLFGSQILLLHVKQENKEDELSIRKTIEKSRLHPEKTNLYVEKGAVAETILGFCKKHGVDLLVAGALKKENLLRSFLGSVGRDIFRAANFSVLILTEPSEEPAPFKEIVVDGSEHFNTQKAIEAACYIARVQKARQVHILKDIKLYGLTMSIAREDSEKEISDHRRKLVQQEVDHIKKRLQPVNTGQLKINIKIFSGKTGFEISRFARKTEADLIVVGGPEKKLGFIDRMMSHDLEYLLSDIPANMLIVH